MELSAAEQARLDRDGFCLTNQTFKQSFQPYLRDETIPRFITADSLLNGFHVVLEETVRQLESCNEPRLARALLRTWNRLDDSAEPAALLVARMLIGTALRVLHEPADLGEWNEELEPEVQRVVRAEEQGLPEWLQPAGPGMMVVDYQRFRVRGLYRGDAGLEGYFRAFAWLRAIPLRMGRAHELMAAWLICRAQSSDRELLTLRNSYGQMSQAGDWDLGFFSGREEWSEFQQKALALPAALGLDQVGLWSEPSLRYLSGLSLPESLYFQKHFPQTLPEPRTLCAALSQHQLELKSNYLLHSYFEVLNELLEVPPQCPPFMQAASWRRKAENTLLAGWAQMRHTWALHAKELYCVGGFTEYPKPVGFVEPLPRFYRALGDLVDRFRDFFESKGALEPPFEAITRNHREFAAQLLRDRDLIRDEDLHADLRRRDADQTAQSVLLRAESLRTLPEHELSFWASTCGKPLVRIRWSQLRSLCLELAVLADKQLRGQAQSEQDREFILDYGDTLASLMFYDGEVCRSPDDDAPRIAEIAVDPLSGKRLQVGVGRPRAIFVRYSDVLCRGSVMPYAELVTEVPLTNEEWRTYTGNHHLPYWAAD